VLEVLRFPVGAAGPLDPGNRLHDETAEPFPGSIDARHELLAEAGDGCQGALARWVVS
jgi:hypothetical protein